MTLSHAVILLPLLWSAAALAEAKLPCQDNINQILASIGKPKLESNQKYKIVEDSLTSARNVYSHAGFMEKVSPTHRQLEHTVTEVYEACGLKDERQISDENWKAVKESVELKDLNRNAINATARNAQAKEKLAVAKELTVTCNMSGTCSAPVTASLNVMLNEGRLEREEAEKDQKAAEKAYYAKYAELHSKNSRCSNARAKLHRYSEKAFYLHICEADDSDCQNSNATVHHGGIVAFQQNLVRVSLGRETLFMDAATCEMLPADNETCAKLYNKDIPTFGACGKAQSAVEKVRSVVNSIVGSSREDAAATGR